MSVPHHSQVVVAALAEVGEKTRFVKESGSVAITLGTNPEVLLKATNLVRNSPDNPPFPDVGAMLRGFIKHGADPAQIESYARRWGVGVDAVGTRLGIPGDSEVRSDG